MITVLLFIFAAFFKAVADTLKWHFDTSIFKKLNPIFWNPVVSSEYIGFFPGTKYRPDAWHLANSAMLACMMFAAIFNNMTWPWYGQLAVVLTLFLVTFNTFFNKILR